MCLTATFNFFGNFWVKSLTLGTHRKIVHIIFLSGDSKTAVWDKMRGQNPSEWGQRKCSNDLICPYPPPAAIRSLYAGRNKSIFSILDRNRT